MQVQKMKKGYKIVEFSFGTKREIPEDWRVETLETCCNILDSKRIPINSEERRKIKGSIPYYGANGIQDYINKHLFDEDLILLAEDGGYFDEYQTRPIAYMVTGKSWVNNHAHILNSKEGYDLKWIFYSLTHKNILSYINGSTRTKLNQSDLRNIEILMPSLLKEQQKIASILSSIDNLIDTYGKTIEKTKKLKKGLMNQLLTKGVGHTKFKKIKWYFGKETEIPEEWDWKPVTDVFHLRSGSTPKRDHPEYFNGDIPWVSSTDLNRGIVSKTIEKITDDGVKDARLKIFPRGTFIIAIYGLEAAGTRGKCGILETDAAINQACMAFFDGKKITTNFLHQYYLLNGEKVAFSYAQGTKQQNLSNDILKFWHIPIPSPEEQQKITSILSNVDSQIQKQQEYKAKLETLKKGLMQKLLTGRIRVKV